MRTHRTLALNRRERAGLDGTLSHLLRGVGYSLGPNLLGAYLVGSFALDAGDRQSDVDFAVITHRPVSLPELAELRSLHAMIPDGPTFGADHLEGSYIPVAGLAHPGSADWLYVDNGSRMLGPSSHDDTLAFRWALREKGKALVGPAARSFTPVIDDLALRTEARARAIEWRDLLRATPETVDDSWAQTHFVTGLCRLLYTADRGTITSKHRATVWAGRHLGREWRGLLTGALQQRSTTWERVGTAADPALASATVALAEEVCGRISARR